MFKCKAEDGTVIFSQTECKINQTDDWIQPIPQSGVLPFEPDTDFEKDDEDNGQTASRSVTEEVANINKQIDKSIKSIYKPKSSSAVVNRNVAELEISRLEQIATTPIYPEADKNYLIRKINRSADIAVQRIRSNLGSDSSNAIELITDIQRNKTSLITAIRRS